LLRRHRPRLVRGRWITLIAARLPLPLPIEKAQRSFVGADQNKPSAETSDESLMAGICDGDKEAMASLFFADMPAWCVPFPIESLRDTSEADDLLQDIFRLVNRDCRALTAPKARPSLGFSKCLPPCDLAAPLHLTSPPFLHTALTWTKWQASWRMQVPDRQA